MVSNRRAIDDVRDPVGNRVRSGNSREVVVPMEYATLQAKTGKNQRESTR